jgi:hypothetical protein
MLIALAMMAVAQGEPAPEPAPDSEIMVLTERLRSIKISPGVTIRKGVVTQTSACKVKRSSGDAEIDELACAAVTQCASLPQAGRKAFNTCVEEEAVDAIWVLRSERAAARVAQIEAEEAGQ